ncbi:hypothetical protein M1M07_07620 [Rhodococcus sp. HM1]|uniref:HNH endonuclease n=1 Tax=Rhodococcus sp. HM1 TaxID=2937759 RepID=UPI00200A1341|nr:hypothetical protein [Rhodococcus sp. HM1]MCK8670985.1 hypothetical protein [Rhodococcus sp. HM1]
MAWLRIGDNALTHPRLLRIYENPNATTSLLLETFGFLVACATLAAAHTTDYVVSYGTARLIANEETDRLLDVCMRAGLMDVDQIDGIDVWKIVNDPEFIHMRTREEIEWERQRKSDNSNPGLIIPVRLRDGDACRYCGQVVKFEAGARTGRHVGTYDHRAPGNAGTVDTLVVACTRCNSGRKNDPLADERYPLLPAPSKPYYSPHTRKWIREHEWARANGFSITARRGKTVPPGTVPEDRKTIVEQYQRSGTQPDTATDPRPATQADNATTATRPPAGHRTTERPAGQADTAPTDTTATPQPVGERDTRRQRTGTPPETASTTPPRPADKADHANTQHHPSPAATPALQDSVEPAETLPPSSGRAGSGRVGSGRDGDAGNPPSTETSPARSNPLPQPAPRRRGRRGRNRKTGH